MCRLVTGHKATALQEVYFLYSGWFFSFCCIYYMEIGSPAKSRRLEGCILFHVTKINLHACEHWLPALSIQISQVCQLCQQSPRLFTNHAAQLHTLLVSIFSLILCVSESDQGSSQDKHSFRTWSQKFFSVMSTVNISVLHIFSGQLFLTLFFKLKKIWPFPKPPPSEQQLCNHSLVTVNRHRQACQALHFSTCWCSMHAVLRRVILSISRGWRVVLFCCLSKT